MDASIRTIRPGADWKPGADREFGDIRYETAEGIAKITICRPEVRNAFRPQTLFELRDAFEIARDDPAIGVIVLTGEGPDAFCSGGDQRVRGDDGYRDEHGIGRLNVLDLQVQIRRLPKPVVAMVAGLRDRRRPRAARRVRPHHRGRQRALRPDRPERRVVRRRLRVGPARAQRRAEEGARDLVPLRPVRRAGGARHGPRQQGRAPRRRSKRRRSPGAGAMLSHSPLALRMIKASMNAADDGLAGIQQLAGDATLLYYMSEEAQEGKNAYLEKRRPDFDQFPKRP